MGLADIFKSKEYKRKINELTVQNERLSEDVAELKNVQMSIQQMSLMDIEIEITKKDLTYDRAGFEGAIRSTEYPHKKIIAKLFFGMEL